MIDYLYPGCIVRIGVKDNDSGSIEAIYFKITEIKDGTFWGTAMDTYRLDSKYPGIFAPKNRVEEGEQFTWRKGDINEVPLDWQTKRYQKAVAHLEVLIKDKGYGITGLR